jgi:hypothetical protein
MSRNSFKKMTEMDDLIQKGGRGGVRLLLLFKLLKIRVEERIRRVYPNATIQETTLNRLCVQKANELSRLGKQSPTERDVEDLLSRLRG